MKQNLPAQTLLRRALVASTLTLIVGTVGAFAQSSGGSGSSKYGAGQQPVTDPATNPTTNTRRQSNEPGISADAQATREINAASGTTTTTERLNWGDRRFINKTSDSGMAEVQIAQLAVQKASDPAVKAFAQKLVDEHTKLNSELATLASEKGVMLDKDDGKDRAYKRLNRQTGAEFDQEFVEHMVEGHEDGIKRFEKAAMNAKDPAVRSFASNHVSALREHLQEAQSLQATVANAGSTRARSRAGSLASPSGSYDTTPAGPAPDANRTNRPNDSTNSRTPAPSPDRSR